MCVWLSPFAVPLKLPQHCLSISYFPIRNEKLKKKIQLATDSSLDQKTLGREFSFTVQLISNVLSRNLPPNHASETLNEAWFTKRIFQTLLFKPVGKM